MTEFEEFVESQLKDIEIPEVGESGYGAHLVELWEHLAFHVAQDIEKTTEKRGTMPDGIRYLMPGGMSLEVWFDHRKLEVHAKAEYPKELIALLLTEVSDAIAADEYFAEHPDDPELYDPDKDDGF